MQPKVAIHDRTSPDNILLPGDNHNLAAPTPATTEEKSLAYKIVYMVPLKEFIWVNQNLVCSELHAGKAIKKKYYTLQSYHAVKGTGKAIC